MKNKRMDGGGPVRRVWERQSVRYLFFGGLTVLVNLICFSLLTRRGGLGVDGANALSILAALLFAYWVNTRFVFRDHARSAGERLGRFLRFTGARLFTMALEWAGVHLLVSGLSLNAFFSKTAVQAVVIVLNYVLSRALVYRSAP